MGVVGDQCGRSVHADSIRSVVAVTAVRPALSSNALPMVCPTDATHKGTLVDSMRNI